MGRGERVGADGVLIGRRERERERWRQMVERASDYDFVTFEGEGTDITIDGNIMPKRSSSDRTLRAVDPAFINESIYELQSILFLTPSILREEISKQIRSGYYNCLYTLEAMRSYFYSAYSFSGTDYVASPSQVLPQILTHFTPITSLASSRSDFCRGAPLDKSKVQNVFTDLQKFLYLKPVGVGPSTGPDLTAWTQNVTSNYRIGWGTCDLPTTADGLLICISGYRIDYNRYDDHETEGFTYTLTASAGTITLRNLGHIPDIVKYLDQNEVSVLAVYEIYHHFVNGSDVVTDNRYAIMPCSFNWVNNNIQVNVSDTVRQAAGLIEPRYTHYNQMPESESGVREYGWVDLEELYVVLARGDHTDFWSE